MLQCQFVIVMKCIGQFFLRVNIKAIRLPSVTTLSYYIFRIRNKRNTLQYCKFYKGILYNIANSTKFVKSS